MKVLINADFQNEQHKDHFIKVLNAVAQMCDAHIDVVDSAEDIPTVDIASDTFTADLANQQALAVELPPAPIELSKEPEVEQSAEIELGGHQIISLNGATTIPAKFNPALKNSVLMVTSEITNVDGLLTFWFGGTMFKTPPGYDRISNIANPDHEIGPSTIRIVAKKASDDTAYGMLVDLIQGDMEMLVLGGGNTTFESVNVAPIIVALDTTIYQAKGEEAKSQEVVIGALNLVGIGHERGNDGDTYFIKVAKDDAELAKQIVDKVHRNYFKQVEG